jgi:diguanylate cyclase (GGDEF)-like protein
MKRQDLIFKIFSLLILGCGILLIPICSAKIIGMPPIKSIEIPVSAYGDHFDMVVDNDNVIYITSVNGVKIYNGSKWILVKTPNSQHIRTLYYDNKKRVYIGGKGIIAYIEKDSFGQYAITDITPAQYHSNIESIWYIIQCNDDFYFSDTHDVFRYSPIDGKKKHWAFTNKSGVMYCYQDNVLLQDREVGLLQLQEEQWLPSTITLNNNELIYQLLQIDENSIFIMSASDEWRLITDDVVTQLHMSTQLPNLDNYVSAASLGKGKLVLGTNNGLLTFVDSNTLKTESFQLSNEWIAKIIRLNDAELMVLTEFKIFFISWPSPIRVLGKDAGLSSNIFDMTNWNGKFYVSSSAGVFVEEQRQMIYQHQLFRRLNWTNKEAWQLLPINEKQAILAESHKLMLVEDGQSHYISDIIYPRELIRSQANTDIIFVVTEYDLQLLRHVDDSWQLKKIFAQRPVSLIEQKSGMLLLSTAKQGLYQLAINNKNGEISSTRQVNEQMGLTINLSNGLNLLKTSENEVYAFNQKGLYKLVDNKFINDSIKGLSAVLGDQQLDELKQSENGLLYGNNWSTFVFQDHDGQWQTVETSRYIRGTINSIEAVDNELRIAGNGSIVNYSPQVKQTKPKTDYKILLTEALFNEGGNKQRLPIDSHHNFEFTQGHGSLLFSYTLNDLVNLDKVQYRYRLLGSANENWSDYFSDRQISFNNLKAGEFSFQLQAKDDGNETYISHAYRFKVNPVWYLSTFAKFLWLLLFLLTSGLLFYLLLKWREKIHEVQKKELKSIINKKTLELKKANEELVEIAHTDGLTGLDNRLCLDEFIADIEKKSAVKISVMMVDVDYFKRFNDENGHLAGDELLKLLAQKLKNVINKPTDIVARYGGEEFVIILVNTEPNEAIEKAEKIRKIIENKGQKMSVSIGICHAHGTSEKGTSVNVYHLIDNADKALYQAKKSGRNRVCLFNK